MYFNLKKQIISIVARSFGLAIHFYVILFLFRILDKALRERIYPATKLDPFATTCGLAVVWLLAETSWDVHAIARPFRDRDDGGE